MPRFSTAGPSAALTTSAPRDTASAPAFPLERPATSGVFVSMRALPSERATVAATRSSELRMPGETLLVTPTVPERIRTALAEAPTTLLDQFAASFQLPEPPVQTALFAEL